MFVNVAVRIPAKTTKGAVTSEQASAPLLCRESQAADVSLAA